MKTYLSIFVVLFFTGCATAHHMSVPVREMNVTIHETGSFAKTQQICYTVSPAFGMVYFACANVDFIRRQCDIFITKNDDENNQFLEHELMHCAGRDHGGEWMGKQFDPAEEYTLREAMSSRMKALGIL